MDFLTSATCWKENLVTFPNVCVLFFFYKYIYTLHLKQKQKQKKIRRFPGTKICKGCLGLINIYIYVYTVYVSPIRAVWYLQPLSKLSKTFSCIKLKTIQSNFD